MFDKIFWNIFLNTGDIEAYLSYKSLEGISKTEELPMEEISKDDFALR
ncbi:MAG: YqzL family protein [Bacillota bacterium]